MTPLLIATNRGCTESVKYLLSCQVNIQAQDYKGRTVMHIIAQHQYIPIFKLIMEVTYKNMQLYLFNTSLIFLR